MAEKKYFWLKLKDDFFDSIRIKKLRTLAGGDTFTIIYLKMLTKAMKNNGVLQYQGIENNLCDEIALDINESPDNVEVTLKYLLSCGLAEQIGNDCMFPEAITNVGAETSSAQRVQAFRAKQKALTEEVATATAKTNAERQKAYRAKQNCEKQHIPLIEDYINKKRYNGNYYIVFQRDRYRCAMCESTENLCVHHIDGYDENKPQNSEANKMVVLCRTCHSKVHRSDVEIPTDILDAIGYDSNVTCNDDVTQVKQGCNTEIDIDIEIDKEKEIDKGKPTKKFTPPTLEEVQAYCHERGNSIDAEQFISYYNSNGWMVGRNKMKSWKDAVITWEKNEKQKPKPTGNGSILERLKNA